MPPTRQAQQVASFLGVNLRRDRVTMADDELASSINADLHTMPGTIVLRLGRTKQFTSALADQAIRHIARINGVRYQVAADAVYRNQVQVLTGLSQTSLFTTLAGFRPLNDTTTFAFIADDLLMRKDSGSAVTQWGITAPSATPVAAVGAAGALTGDYSFKFTYRRKVGSAIAHESNPSPASNTIALTADRLSGSGLTASTDAQVTHIGVYRTVAGGSDYFEDQEIDNGTTTFTSNAADSALGDQLEEDNDPPPEASWVTAFQEHLWLCRDAANPHYLWWSKRFRPESFPTENFLEIGTPDDALQCALPLAGFLAVVTQRTKYRVVGSVESGFLAQEALSKRGTVAALGCQATELGVLLIARDGVWLSSLIAPDQEISARITPLFLGETVNDIAPINFDAASTIRSAVGVGRFYLALPTGTSTVPNLVAVYSQLSERWYFYDWTPRSFFFEADTGDLTAGFGDGFVYVLEDGDSDAGADIALAVQSKDYYGQAIAHRKLFLWVRIDCETLGDSVTYDLYVDGVLQRSVAVTSSRTRRLIAFPEGAMGFTWRVGIRYTGRKRVRTFAIEALWLPLEPS